MLFNSLFFLLVFLPTSWAAYALVVRAAPSSRVTFLALLSLLFYGSFDLRFVPLLAGSILVNWLLAGAFASRPRQGWPIPMAIMVNLALLGTFKYLDFLAGVLALLAGVRGYLLKSDAQGHLIEAIATLARHEAYISGQVSGTLLEAVLKPGNLQDGDPLTVRERTVVQLIAEGRTSREICPILNVSIKTVETHRASAMRKIGATSTADIVHYAIRHRMVEV